MLKNWTKGGSQAEQEMEDSHITEWLSIIEDLKPDDFQNYSILDFGCNQGAFLRHLHEKYPFNKAIGIDLASEPIRIANERKGDLPINYYTTETFKTHNETFDIAISNSVVFFIEDLRAHAKEINGYLNESGIYYFTFCDFIKSPNIAYIKDEVNSWAETPLILHSLDEIVKIFSEEGFSVETKRLQSNHFIPLEYKDQWYVNIYERLSVQYEDGYLFRMVKNKQ